MPFWEADLNAAIDIVHRIRSVEPQFDREVTAKRAAVRKKKVVVTDQQLLLKLEGIPADILEAVAKELKL